MSMKILIVEDNLQMRQMIRALVVDLADAVTECVDGDEAVTAYETQQFSAADWVLMDLQMPRVGGLQATRRVLLSTCRKTLWKRSLRNALHSSRCMRNATR